MPNLSTVHDDEQGRDWGNTQYPNQDNCDTFTRRTELGGNGRIIILDTFPSVSLKYGCFNANTPCSVALLIKISLFTMTGRHPQDI